MCIRDRYKHSVVSLALDCFVSVISLVLYRKCHFCICPSSFTQILENGDVPLELGQSALDKFWMHYDVLYDFTADLTGIGDRSVRESS